MEQRMPESEWQPAILDALREVAGFAAQSLERAARGSSAGVSPPTDETLLNSDLGLTLADLAAVADGEDRGTDAEDVQGMVQSVAEALFARPGTAVYDVPPDWWLSGVGRLCRIAQSVVSGDDDLMSIAEAAALLGVTTQTVSIAIRTGRLQAVAQPSRRPRPPKRPRGRRLVLRSEVERWQAQRDGER